MEEGETQVNHILSSSNYFILLGLPVPSHPSDAIEAKLVKKHYKKAALLVHPDKNTHPQANEAFKILAKAFECLYNPHSQSEYILTLKTSSKNKRKKQQ
jgi:DnaJ family protein B protein 12